MTYGEALVRAVRDLRQMARGVFSAYRGAWTERRWTPFADLARGQFSMCAKKLIKMFISDCRKSIRAAASVFVVTWLRWKPFGSMFRVGGAREWQRRSPGNAPELASCNAQPFLKAAN